MINDNDKSNLYKCRIENKYGELLMKGSRELVLDLSIMKESFTRQIEREMRRGDHIERMECQIKGMGTKNICKFRTLS